MNLPNDPAMLLSFINTQLRDNYESLTELAGAFMTDADTLSAKLSAINYTYDSTLNQFV